MTVRFWIFAFWIVVLTFCIYAEVVSHQGGCIQDGFRVRHFDVSKPKWGIKMPNAVHGHELVHPRNRDLNYLQWFNSAVSGGDCPKPRPKPAPAPEPEPAPKPKPKPEPTPEPEPEPAPKPKPKPAPIVEPLPEPEPEPVVRRPAPQPQPIPEVIHETVFVPEPPPEEDKPAPEVMPEPRAEDEPSPEPVPEAPPVVEVEPVPEVVPERCIVRTTLPAGITLFHVPCRVDGVNRITDVMRLLGDDLFYMLSLDAEAQRFDVHIPRYAMENDRRFMEHEAFIVVMKKSVDLVLEGEKITSDIVLYEGFNLVEGRDYGEHIAVSYNDEWLLGALPVVSRGMLVVVQ